MNERRCIIMAQATFSVRMDSTLKKNLDQLCAEFGMTTSTAINIFAKAVVREKRIPFEIKAPSQPEDSQNALNAFFALREKAAHDFPQELSLEEINQEIDNSRSENNQHNNEAVAI